MISIIVPFFNEEESLQELNNQLTKILEKNKIDYEIIYVDDGSSDGSESKLKDKSENIKVISHTRRQGKGRALLSGFNSSKGDTIVFMDADLQNDPADIPQFIEKINEGYDFVNGAREERYDGVIIKMYSSLGNWFLKKFLNSPFTDVNCGFKVFKRQVLKEVVLYANNFRFLPIAAYLKGFKVTELVIKHHKRMYGKSKFGVDKIFVGFFDTITAYFIYKFSERPLHFFGPIGGIVFLIGFILSLYLAMERIFYGVLLFRRPILLLGILLIIVGIQIVMTGIIGELIVYFSKKKNQ